MRQARRATQAEFVICEQSIDTNHGYAQQRAENSEVSKRRAELEQRLANLQRWAEGARVRGRRATRLYVWRCRETKEQAKALYRTIGDHQWALVQQGVDDRTLRTIIKEEQRVADAEIASYEQRQWRAYDQSNAEYDKGERYCRKQRELLRQLEDLKASEREMFELDHAKDQVMSVLKLALVNMAMWARDHYFPATYAHATWHRLAPFFQVPGRVVWGTDSVHVELYPFNDRRLRCDLETVCAQVTAAQVHLPDGRLLRFWLSGTVSGRGGEQSSPAYIGCQTWMVSSSLPEAMRLPSGDQASVLTSSVCPL